MHVILASFGTDGDVFPYLGLGTVLRSRGHRVTLLANEHFRTAAAEHGFAFDALITADEYQRVLDDPDFWHPLKAGIVAARWGAPLIERQYELVTRLACDAETVLVASPAVFAARLAQEKLGLRMATVVLQPWIIPSLSAPPTMPGGLTLPRWTPRPLGRLYWRAVNAVGGFLLGRDLNRLRTALELKPVHRLLDWWLSPQLVLGLFPESYAAPQNDWPAQLRLTGFPMYDGRPSGELPPDLIEFCRAGDPPVVFTFGTGMTHAAKLFRMAVEACQLVGVRGLLLTKFDKQIPSPLPPSIRHCRFAPFRRLFPECSAVVHHGGIGTVAHALAAGIPQLILPIAYDQFDNAIRVQRLGAGEWIRARRASGRRIAKALARLTPPHAQHQGRELTTSFDDSGGLERAADRIEKLASHSPLASS